MFHKCSLANLILITALVTLYADDSQIPIPMPVSCWAPDLCVQLHNEQFAYLQQEAGEQTDKEGSFQF